MHKGKILIIDDENQYRRVLARVVELEGYEVFQAENGRSGLKILDAEPEVLVTLCDVRLPDMNGLLVLDQIKASHFLCEVILLTAYGSINDGVNAIKNGAFDYYTKDNGGEQLLMMIDKAIDKAKLNQRVLDLETKLKTRYSFDRIIGMSPIINSTIQLAQKVSVTDSTVLLEGETGTGKELFAQAIHTASPRRRKPFVAVNCSAFPKDLLESEIFGHKKGAFTGAINDKKGLFEEANEGTLFLDEIGELHPELQAKLLRVLEDQTFTKLGDSKPTKVNVRIIAATNRDLLKETKGELFRADLYYRLSVFKISIPSLRERKLDIPLLVNYFLSTYGPNLNKKVKTVSPQMLHILESYDWPGNTRELKNMIERAVILCENEVLTPELLPYDVFSLSGKPTPDNSECTLEEIEKRHIIKILSLSRGNKSQAAKKLGIGIPTLYRKLEQYGLRDNSTEG